MQPYSLPVNRMRAVRLWVIPRSQSKISCSVLKSPHCCWFITEGLQLKSNADWLPSTACHFEYIELLENNIASLFLQLFLTQNSGSLTAVKTSTSELGSTHSLASGTRRLEMLSIFFEDELKQRLPM